MMSILIEALGLILGSFAIAIGLTAAVWAIFVRANHPEWAAPAILSGLAVLIASRPVLGEFVSMAMILIGIMTPILWFEGRAWRERKLKKRL